MTATTDGKSIRRRPVDLGRQFRLQGHLILHKNGYPTKRTDPIRGESFEQWSIFKRGVVGLQKWSSSGQAWDIFINSPQVIPIVRTVVLRVFRYNNLVYTPKTYITLHYLKSNPLPQDPIEAWTQGRALIEGFCDLFIKFFGIFIN